MYNVTSVKELESVIEALQAIANAIPPANPVPDVTSADDGKVLKATYSGGEGSYDWEDESGGVPDYSQAEQGSVLATQYGGELGWDRPENLLPESSLVPEITGNDDGKVLQAVYNDKSGSYAQWVTPSGGGITELEVGTISSSDTWSQQTDSGSDVVGYYLNVVSSVLSQLSVGGVMALKVSDSSYAYVDYWYINDKSGAVKVYLTKQKFEILGGAGNIGATLIYLK